MKYIKGINKRHNNISSKTMFQWLFWLVWSQHTLFLYVEAIIGKIPYFASISNYIFPSIVVLLILASANYFITTIKPLDIVFVFLYLAIILVSIILTYKNAYYIETDLWRMFGLTLPMYFLGLGYSHDDLKNGLFWFSLFGVGLMLVYQVYLLASGSVLNSDNMDASYKALPSIIYLVYWAFEKKKLIYWIPVSIGGILAFAFGTRGSILIIVMFLSVSVLFYITKLKSLFKKVICYVAIFACLGVFLSEEITTKIAKFLLEKFGEIGFSTRIFEFLINGQLAESDGRKIIARKVLSAIREKPIMGYGIMGDRVVLDAGEGEYAHNIVLEIFCDFGVVLGTILILMMLFIVIKGIIKAKSDQRLFVVGLSLLVFIKLSLSGSFLVEPYLFLLLGICISTIRGSKIKCNNRRSLSDIGVVNNENCSN